MIAGFAAALLLVLVTAALAIADEAKRLNVLLLYAEPRLGPAIMAMDEAFRAALEARAGGAVYFYTEWVDVTLYPDNVPQREMRDVLVRKYAGRRLDLVFAVSSRVLRIAVQNRALLFPGAPIVFAATDPAASADVLTLDPNLTGTWLKQGWAGTLEAAMRLHPNARRAVIVTGSGVVDQTWLAAAKAQLAPYQQRIELEYLSGRSFGDTLERAAALGPGTVLVVGPFTRDADGRDFVSAQAAAEIARTARVPVYGLNEAVIGNGLVGGDVVDFRSHGVRAAELAAGVLKGERPPPTSEGTNALMFDWRQLQRWSIDERRLPPGSIVRFREPSVWDSYKRYIVGAAVVFVLQTGLIAGLLVNRAQRRRAQTALAERLRFETLLTELSATFVTLGTAGVDAAIEDGLRRIVLELDIDRAALFEVRARDRADVTHAWTRDGVPPRPTTVELGRCPWMAARLAEGQVLSIAHAGDLPDEATTDRSVLAELGVRSLLAVPFTVGAARWAVGFTTVRMDREWSDELIQRLRPVTEVFAHALERLHAERAMRESEARFRLLADSAPLMIWMSLPNGQRTYFNERWLQLTGSRSPEVFGDGWLAGVHADDRDATIKAIHQAVGEQRPFTVEYRLRRADGDHRRVIDHGVPRRAGDGTLAGYIGSGVDVTELRAVQKELLESNALRSAIFGSLYGNVVAVDRAGTIIAVNESWRRLAGTNNANPEEVSVGASYFDVCQRASGMTDADARRAVAAVAGVLAGEGDRAHLEYLARIDHEDRWFELTVEPFRRSAGGAVVSHVDVTRRRQAEDEARRQREVLAHTLRITTLGELAASLAHEINQPLAAIVTNAQATTRLLDAGSAMTQDVRAALRDIAADGKRASEIIRRLRALFRKEQVPLRPLNVNELTAEALSLVDYDLARKAIEIRSAYDPALPPVPVDPVQIQQVILNLVINASEAIAAANDGPRVITVATAPRATDRVEISVADTGVGAARDELERMFEPFVTTKSDGLGMGLAISRSIVQAHGGKIWATVNADRGLTMHIEVPTESPSAV